MWDDIPWAKIGEWSLAVLSGGGLVAFFSWLKDRREGKRADMVALDEIKRKGIDQVIDTQAKTIQNLDERLGKFQKQHDEEVAELRQKHKECEERGERIQSTLNARDDEQQGEIDQLKQLHKQGG